MKEKDISFYISKLEKRKKYSPMQLKLIEEDLQYGLDAADVERYCEPEYDYSQMEVYSRCLRSGFSDEVIAVVCKDGLSGQQMKVALEYFEKGISIETVKQIADGSLTAVNMQKAYLGVLENLEEAQKASKQEPEYIKTLMEEIRNVVDKIDYQEKRYDALNEKLAELDSVKKDGQEKKKLEAEIIMEKRHSMEKDQLLSGQQDSINQANIALARLRKENEELKEDLKRMEKQQGVAEKEARQIRIMESPRDMVGSYTGSPCMGREKEEEVGKPESKRGKASAPAKVENEGCHALLAGYQVVVTDQMGKVVANIPIEKKRQKKSAAVHIFTRIVHKKKPRQDIIRQVISGELEKEQLVQIRVAMERGLTEQQLVELINSGVSAEQMEEIIEIAVLENSMDE